MMVTTPVPSAAPKAAPAPAPAAPATATPKPTVPAADDAPSSPATSQAAAGAKGDAKAPPAGGAAAPADAEAAKQAVLDELEKTTAQDAIAKVDDHLEKIAALTVGGGTPEGAQSAKVASALLTDSSMLLQHAHIKAIEQLRTMAAELNMRVMSSASGLAFLGGQVALAGQSKEPVKLADIVAGPIKDTKAAMADVISAITPKDAKGDAPAKGDASPAAPATPATSSGNTGVVPGGLQHVTPGPGTGPGPHPA